MGGVYAAGGALKLPKPLLLLLLDFYIPDGAEVVGDMRIGGLIYSSHQGG